MKKRTAEALHQLLSLPTPGQRSFKLEMFQSVHW